MSDKPKNIAQHRFDKGRDTTSLICPECGQRSHFVRDNSTFFAACPRCNKSLWIDAPNDAPLAPMYTAAGAAKADAIHSQLRRFFIIALLLVGACAAVLLFQASPLAIAGLVVVLGIYFMVDLYIVQYQVIWKSDPQRRRFHAVNVVISLIGSMIFPEKRESQSNVLAVELTIGSRRAPPARMTPHRTVLDCHKPTNERVVATGSRYYWFCDVDPDQGFVTAYGMMGIGMFPLLASDATNYHNAACVHNWSP